MNCTRLSFVLFAFGCEERGGAGGLFQLFWRVLLGSLVEMKRRGGVSAVDSRTNEPQVAALREAQTKKPGRAGRIEVPFC